MYKRLRILGASENHVAAGRWCREIEAQAFFVSERPLERAELILSIASRRWQVLGRMAAPRVTMVQVQRSHRRAEEWSCAMARARRVGRWWRDYAAVAARSAALHEAAIESAWPSVQVRGVS